MIHLHVSLIIPFFVLISSVSVWLNFELNKMNRIDYHSYRKNILELTTFQSLIAKCTKMHGLKYSSAKFANSVYFCIMQGHSYQLVYIGIDIGINIGIIILALILVLILGLKLVIILLLVLTLVLISVLIFALMYW